MLLISLGLIFALFLVLAFVTPAKNEDDSPVPSSYRTGKHGAKAAYTLLEQSGYQVSRWEEPLSILARDADASTVLILAGPYSQEPGNKTAIRAILKKGGRVLATGFWGGVLLPGNAVAQVSDIQLGVCEAQPSGLGPLAVQGTVWMESQATWKDNGPEFHTAYTCGSKGNTNLGNTRPVVVEYEVEKGHAVWWADSTPLENSYVGKGKDLELLLNSVGPAAGHHVYWDESLHGRTHSPWDYTTGPVWKLLLWGILGAGLLVVLSFSRRSGPVRSLPQVPRTTPIEFLEALGALYRSAGATSVVAQVAWDRFRTESAKLCGQSSRKLSAALP